MDFGPVYIIFMEKFGFDMKIAVYLGSHRGNDPVYCETAYELGLRLARKGIGVVYGGARVGTMGELARGVADGGGECIGVYPKGFRGRPAVAREGIEVKQEGLTDFIEVDGFPQRKQMMEDLSDCCVALPGSWGTLDELFAYTTSTQLEFNGGKRLFVLNIKGFYDDLKRQILKMNEEGFIDAGALGLITFCDSVDELLSKLGE